MGPAEVCRLTHVSAEIAQSRYNSKKYLKICTNFTDERIDISEKNGSLFAYLIEGPTSYA